MSLKERWQDPAFKELMKKKIAEGRAKAKENREIKKDLGGISNANK